MNAEQYKRDGWTVLKGAFTPGWKSKDIEQKCLGWQAMPREDYLRAARLFSKGASQTAMFLQPSITQVVRQLGIVDPIFLTSPAIHVMGADQTWDGVAAHQDWPALQSSLNTVVVWMPFTDVGLDNYPIEFANGSHRRGLIQAKPSAHYSEVEAAGMDFVPVPVNVGDAIFFSAFTVHRTRTPGKGFRLAFSMRYEDAADDWFKAHGNYSAQSRVIAREIKDAPSMEQVQAVFK